MDHSVYPTALDRIAAHARKASADYWRRKFSGFDGKVRIPYTKAAQRAGVAQTSQVCLQLDQDAIGRVQRICSGSTGRELLLYLSALSVLMARYTGCDDVSIGVPMQRQDGPSANHLIPVRIKIDLNASFAGHIVKVRDGFEQDQLNGDYPLAMILENLDIVATPLDCPLFDVGLMHAALHDDDCFRPFEPALKLLVGEAAGVIRISYDPRTYTHESMKVLGDHLVFLIGGLTLHVSSKPICQVWVLPDRQAMQPEKDEFKFPTDKNLFDLVEGCAERYPHRVAIQSRTSCLTFSEFSRIAMNIAGGLEARGVGRGDRIVVYMGRSPETFVAFLGIVAAGGIYVNIPVAAPPGRCTLILEDCDPACIIYDADVPSPLARTDGRCIRFDELAAGSNTGFNTSGGGPAPAYIIYTSGTTGKPKGVLISHESLINLVYGMKEKIHVSLSGTARLAVLSAFDFDASMQNVFAALFFGFTMVIIDDAARRDGDGIVSAFHRHLVQVSDGTPAHLALILAARQQLELSSIHFIIGGDRLPKDLLLALWHKNIRTRLTFTNVYGPSETCVNSTYYNIAAADLHELEEIPIGYSLPNQEVLIVDNAGNELEPGIPGEILIGGVGVFIGYYRNPELTALRILRLRGKAGMGYYRTGDLGRLTGDGAIMFMGRNDDQVKINGFRIELGEIESVMRKHPSIKNVVADVVTYGDSDRRIVAKVETSDGSDELQGWRSFFIDKLPPFMIPSEIRIVERFPLMTNGKLDKQALRLIEGVAVVAENTRGHLSPMETWLADIVREELGGRTVDPDLGFYEMGLHSLRMMKFAGKVNRSSTMKLTLADLFEHNTIRKVAKFLGTRINDEKGLIAAERRAYYRLSPAQKRMYFTQSAKPDDISYNLREVLELEGDLDVERLSVAFRALVRRHAALRTAYILHDGLPYQQVLKEVDARLVLQPAPCGEMKDRAIDDFIRAFPAPFDLSTPPLIRAALMPIAEKRHLLLLDVHHIVTDARSTEILESDLLALYRKEALDPVKFEYVDHAECLAHRRTLHQTEADAYWHSQLARGITRLDLPYDHKRPQRRRYLGNAITISFPQQTTAQLKKICEEAACSVYAALVTIVNLFLSAITGQTDIIIGTSVAGRTHPDLENIVGLFANVVILRNEVIYKNSFLDHLSMIKRCVQHAVLYQDKAFDELAGQFNDSASLARTPLFDVAFFFEEASSAHSLTPADLKIRRRRGQVSSARFDLAILATTAGAQIAVTFNYDTDLFTDRTVRMLTETFTQIATALVESPEDNVEGRISPEGNNTHGPIMEGPFNISL